MDVALRKATLTGVQSPPKSVAVCLLAALIAVPAWGMTPWPPRDDTPGDAPGAARLHAARLYGGLPAAADIRLLSRLPAPVARSLKPAFKEARRGNYDAAYLVCAAAARDFPHNEFVRAHRETFRQMAVFGHLVAGKKLESSGASPAAALEYLAALDLDPGNTEARAGALRAEGLAEWPHSRFTAPISMRVKQAAPPVRLLTDLQTHDIHFRGSLQDLIAELAHTYGVSAYIQNGLPASQVRFDVADATWPEALVALRDATGVDAIPLDAHTAYFGQVKDLDSKRRLATRTFYLTRISTAEEFSEMAQALRATLGLQSMDLNMAQHAIIVRDTPMRLDVLQALLDNMNHPAGEVMLDVRLLEVDEQVASELGVNWPGNFEMLSLGQYASLLNGLNLQQLLNGGNPAALQQLEQQLGPLLSTPFVVFGGGATLMALTIPNLTAAASLNNSHVATVETAVLRSSSGETANLKIGERYPIMTANYSPAIQVPQSLLNSLGNQNNGLLTGGFPSFPQIQYQDLGLVMKIKPYVEGDGQISLSLDSEVKALTGQFANQLPILSDRHLQTELVLNDGEPALVAGLFSDEESSSLAAIPGLGQIPVLGRAFRDDTRNSDRIQLVIVITPHILGMTPAHGPEIWVPPGVFAETGATFVTTPLLPAFTPYQRRPGMPGFPYQPGRPGEPIQPGTEPPAQPAAPGTIYPMPPGGVPQPGYPPAGYPGPGGNAPGVEQQPPA
jgi:general secretion pathway protein D